MEWKCAQTINNKLQGDFAQGSNGRLITPPGGHWSCGGYVAAVSAGVSAASRCKGGLPRVRSIRVGDSDVVFVGKVLHHQLKRVESSSSAVGE